MSPEEIKSAEPTTGSLRRGVVQIWTHARTYAVTAAIVKALILCGAARTIGAVLQFSPAGLRATDQQLTQVGWGMLLYLAIGPLILVPLIRLKLRTVLRKSTGAANA